MSRFPPIDIIATSIEFTKTLYAQVKGQMFHAPPVYPLPLSTNPDYAKYVTGMKIACGMEMLYAREGTSSLIRKRIDEMFTVPTDEEVARWGNKQDDESWLLVNFSDLDQHSHPGRTPNRPDEMQDTVKDMLDKLQEFMGEEGGLDGVELDGESESSEEDQVTFDDQDFLTLLRQELDVQLPNNEPSDSESDGSDLAAMDAEFAELMVQDENEQTVEQDKSDYEIATNILESFKGQAGLPGPAGNMLSRMGLQLPRDDTEEPDE
ncbi:Protein ecdysoneless [Neolecta irregularis DAH-3]|uniref:Protein ecdysoneless n=1 Tax=Neolecta irregularis (strain DAH-3) TaxID=1198029 RepID=A0A1U7LS69_NEOID|nr:Protein ecdysoneless [Neolecta irregularis DAH-3]|eukprot:OLL25515.1 Protein ecdysoneless [Neolecta irregularis DAH-3]